MRSSSISHLFSGNDNDRSGAARGYSETRFRLAGLPTRTARLNGLGLAVGLAWLVFGCQPSPDRIGADAPNPIRDVDLGAVEARVRDKIESSWRRVQQNPQSDDAWGRLGMALQAHSLFAPAVESYQAAIQIAPQDYRWSYLAALAQRKLDLERALPFFEQAEMSNPDNPAFYTNYGDLLVQLGKTSQARTKYLKGLELDSDSSFALHGLARVDLAEDNLESARRHLEKAVSIAPGVGEAHLLLSQVCRRLGDQRCAETELLLARANPEAAAPYDPVMASVRDEAVSSQALIQEALALARNKKYGEAERLFREILQIRPGNSRDFANLGGALAGQEKYDEAIDWCRRALAINPNESYAHNTLALSALSGGRLDEAIQHAKAAIEIDPNYAEAHHTLGLALSKKGKFDEAEQAYDKALQANPALPGVRNDRAKILARLGKLNLAIEEWRLAVAVSPGELESYYNLGAALALAKQYRAAVETFEQGLALAPNSSLFVRALAWQLATAPANDVRDGAKALQLASRLRAQFPRDPAVADCYAAALAEVGRYPEAAEAIREILAQTKLDPSQGGQLLARLNRYRRNQPFRQGQPLDR